MTFKLDFAPNGYEVELSPGPAGELFMSKEECTFQGAGYPRPYTVPLGAGHPESRLPGRTGIEEHVRTSLGSWRVFHFHDTGDAAKVKQKHSIDDNARLRHDAENLAAYLYLLKHRHADSYRQIVAAVRQVAPFFDDFVLEPDRIRPDLIQLSWHERGSDAFFGPGALSDGTLRFICLATLLLQPDLPVAILIDEPELGLHPFAIHTLASLLRAASARTQVIVSTQSVTLMNQFDPSDVIVVDRKGSESTFRRVSDAEVQDWADSYALGELWEKNVIGGRPS